MPFLTVRAAAKDNRVAFSENHKAHPDGSAFVYGNGQEFVVGDTPAVRQAIRQERLVVTQEAPTTAQVPATKTQGGESKPAPPWEGYDQTSADEIVAKLPDLDDAGRAAVLAYEQSKGSRARKTIVEPLVNWNS